MEEFDENTEQLAPSRSQLKREDQALVDLARDLAELPAGQIQQLPLPEQVIDALHAAAAMPPRGARKRQIKFIGGLMRKLDISSVKEHLARLKSQSAHATREHHQTEQWRDRLLSEEKSALTELLNQFPDADRQQLRQLIRNAKKELADEKPAKSSRLLFRYLKTLIAEDSQITEG